MVWGVLQLEEEKVRFNVTLSEELESWIHACWLGKREIPPYLKLSRRLEFTTRWSLTVTLSVGSVCNWTENVSLSVPSVTEMVDHGSSTGMLEPSVVSLSFRSLKTVINNFAVSSSRLTAFMGSNCRSLNRSSSDWTLPKRSSYSTFGPPSTRFSSTSSSTPSRMMVCSSFQLEDVKVNSRWFSEDPSTSPSVVSELESGSTTSDVGATSNLMVRLSRWWIPLVSEVMR